MPGDNRRNENPGPSREGISKNHLLGKGTSRARWLLLAVLLGVFLCARLGRSQESPLPPARRSVTEYEVKAAFLLNFAKFVEWPEPRDNAPFAICTLGDDPFGPVLDRIVQGETINNRSLVVRRLHKWQEPCDVVFIANTERDTAGILHQIGNGVLTVGESADFLRDGGMINFVIADRRVRFDVNRKAADHASVRISSRLLGVARAVLR